MEHIHILGICGYATGGLALMAKKMGYRVTGSDEDAYPPMSTLLTKRGIAWSNLHSADNLKRWGQPDLVIQGNQIRVGNSELREAKSQRLKIISDSAFFYELTQDRRRIVVTGSHGKTTTSALIAWVLEVAGRKPGFRLGTTVKNFKESVRLGKGREFVFEGDEYTTTFDDRRPKFFHFHPHLAIINNIEWDHPDVFKSPQAYRILFKRYLVEQMPRDGLIVYNAEDSEVRKVVHGANCRTVSFGLDKGDLRAGEIKFGASQTSFVVYIRGQKIGRFATKLAGVHNVKNSLAAVALALDLGIEVSKIQKALPTFQGTSRRFEVVSKEKGITVIDDYAHHPTKVQQTIAAARARFPKSRLIAVYVPHTYSRTKALFSDYASAFRLADWVMIGEIEPARERHLSALVHARDLVELLSKNQGRVEYAPNAQAVLERLSGKLKKGDVVLCMSVRGFDNLAGKLMKKLKGTL